MVQVPPGAPVMVEGPSGPHLPSPLHWGEGAGWLKRIADGSARSRSPRVHSSLLMVDAYRSDAWQLLFASAAAASAALTDLLFGGLPVNLSGVYGPLDHL